MKIIGFLLIMFLLFNCQDDSSSIDPPTPARPNPLEGLQDMGRIRFDDPAIGQRSYYIFFDAEFDYVTKKSNFQYSPDTLVLAITGKEAENWVLKDFLTDGSVSRKSNGEGYWAGWADSVFVRHLILDADSIHVLRPPDADFSSFVFYILHGRKIKYPISLVSDPAPINPNCLPFDHPLSGEFMEYTQNYTQLGETFDHLNNYFDNRGMETDGLGYMYAYSPSVGIVRITWVSPWVSDKAKGWDLLSK
jgi:hypothetical protein